MCGRDGVAPESAGAIAREAAPPSRVARARLAVQTLDILGIIAGNGVYPRLLADAARRAGVKKIVAAAFSDETDDRLASMVDEIHWMRVGQLGKLMACFRDNGVANAIMVKVAKPDQDMRFDVPVIGVATVDVATDAHLRVIAIEAGRTLLLEKETLVEAAAKANLSIVAR